MMPCAWAWGSGLEVFLVNLYALCSAFSFSLPMTDIEGLSVPDISLSAAIGYCHLFLDALMVGLGR